MTSSTVSLNLCPDPGPLATQVAAERRGRRADQPARAGGRPSSPAPDWIGRGGQVKPRVAGREDNTRSLGGLCIGSSATWTGRVEQAPCQAKSFGDCRDSTVPGPTGSGDMPDEEFSSRDLLRDFLTTVGSEVTRKASGVTPPTVFTFGVEFPSLGHPRAQRVFEDCLCQELP